MDSGQQQQGTGWSSAYSVQTLLLQMQAFLMELEDEEGTILEQYLSKIPSAIEESKKFQCKSCPHQPVQPWPPLMVCVKVMT